MSKQIRVDGSARKRKYLIAFSTLIGSVGGYRRQFIRIRAKSAKKALRICRDRYPANRFVEIVAAR